jgi:hypothetical protein
MNLIKFVSISLILLMTLSSCGLYKPVSARDTPVRGEDRARKNVKEGRGIAIGDAVKRGKGTNYEFSTSNPLWRASLEILDFIPLNTVDYSGGMIISDWYSDGSQNNESVKITIRFLSNEVRSESIKVVVHKKKCRDNQACKIDLLTKSIIIDELQSSILRKAAKIELEQKKNKKK